jgi:K+ transporter
MVIVSLTYVTLDMRADNEGEGGVMALITLVRRLGQRSSPRVIAVLSALGILGAALFCGDSMITPAISVLSAVEGLKVVDPGLAELVVPITAAIIIGLFIVQRHGTAAVGRFFGPVMIVWFAVIGACGIRGILGHPQILRALSPTYALEFMFGHFHIAFFALAAVVLSVTGAEALYADMGHFGRSSITWAWVGLVLPALVLNYFGQGALLLGIHPLLIGLITFTVLITWQRGRVIVTAAREEAEGPLREFVSQITHRRPALPRIPGTAIFLNRGSETAPLALRANVNHNHVLHQHVIIMSIETPPVPRVPDDERIRVDDLGSHYDGISYVGARFGYMERPNVPAALRLVDPADTEGIIDVDNASYFLSKLDLCAGKRPTMAPWRKRLFIATSHMTADAAGYFGLPLEQTVIIGARIEV